MNLQAPIMRSMRVERGFILVIVVALLGVLAFIAVDFAFLSQQSRHLSQKSLGLSKATLSARSGLEKGLEAAVWQARNPGPKPFQAVMDSAGEDVNRNGIVDAGEDIDGDGRVSSLPLEEDRTPSLALPDATGVRSLVVTAKGLQRGVTWRNSSTNPDQYCLIRHAVPSLDLNAGVVAGEGPVGQAYTMANGGGFGGGSNYSASDILHVFNQPIRRLLNAWGNYHKYLAMVRPGKTYNFDRSTDMGRIDSPQNLMPDLAGAHNPAASFDDFNPSGNHGTVLSELPLGDLLLASRPVGGYTSVESALPIVEGYVKSWIDKAGRGCVNSASQWLYADGSPIPLVNDIRIRAIVDEFRALAVTRPELEPRWIFTMGMIVNSGLNNFPSIGGGVGYFEALTPRSHLKHRNYLVSAMRVDVNRAPASVLAALVHSASAKLGAYNRLHGTMVAGAALTDPIPFQSENNHPCAILYGPANNLIKDKPLFSMTESIRLSQDLILQRNQDQFGHSMCGLRNFLRGWHKGFDAKFTDVFAPDHQFNTVVWGLPDTQFDEVSNYYDYFHGHRRVQILAELLNPHVNDSRVIWDEALPLAVENRKNRLTTANNPFKGLFFTMDEMEQSSHEVGAYASFQSTTLVFSSLGWTSPGVEERLITTRVRLFDKLSVGTQKEFVEACRDPVTLTSNLVDWVTYPELPGVAPSVITGHLAIKPLCPPCPFGEDLQLRVKLNAYDPDPDPTQPKDAFGAHVDAWPIGNRTIAGGANVKARGIFRNSLQPPPAGPITSLYPVGNIETATDLLPGGGIRMSPWSNSRLRGSFNGTNWPNRREALLVLRNSLMTPADDVALPSQSHDPGNPPFVLPSFHEGAISFYLKPRFHCDAPGSKGAAACLFYMPFNAIDMETQDRCLADGLLPAEAFTRSQFTGSLRLSWWSHPHWVTGPRFNLTPDVTWKWPAVSPFAGFPGQFDPGPYYFANMEGRNDPAGSGLGYVFDNLAPVFGVAPVPGGDGIEGHWRVPNPSSNEVLVLEWEIHKYADHDDFTSVDSTLPVPHVGVSAGWGLWDSADDFTPVARGCSYQVPLSRPLWLYDTSDPIKPEYHSVRKCFYMERPVKWVAGPENGTQPRDRRGDMQALLETGRWNHVFIAWRDLWGVLGNSPPTQGGCLAVYLNGSYRKVSPMGHESSAIFFNMDSSQAYRGSTDPTINHSWWLAPEQHAYYQQGNYQGPLSTWGATVSGFGKIYCIPMPAGHTILPLSPPMWQHLTTVPLSPALPTELMSMGMGYSNVFYSHLDSPRKRNLVREFPPQFYFGFEPHTVYREAAGALTVNRHNYGASNIVWGSYMDIQIFAKATQAGLHSPLQSDGGFIPELNGFSDTMLVYPRTTYVEIYPLLVGSASDVLLRKSKLVGVSWSAHIPEYHQFWDDQNAAVVGPDADDVQELSARVICRGVQLGSVDPSFLVSQLPSSPIRHHSLLATPMEVGLVDDIVMKVDLKGPRVTMSTPIIENIDLVFQRSQPSFEYFQMSQ